MLAKFLSGMGYKKYIQLVHRKCAQQVN
jgi:Ulp1 family protease